MSVINNVIPKLVAALCKDICENDSKVYKIFDRVLKGMIEDRTTEMISMFHPKTDDPPSDQIVARIIKDPTNSMTKAVIISAALTIFDDMLYREYELLNNRKENYANDNAGQ